MLSIYVPNTLKIPKNNQRKSKNMKMYNKDEDCEEPINETFQQITIYIKGVQVLIEIIKILSWAEKV